MAHLAEAAAPVATGVPFSDLVAELENFRRGITEAGALPLAGLMLADDVESAVRQAYLERIVAPRRARLRGILTQAVDAGELAADADLDIAGTFFTGSWSSLHVAHGPVPADWATRVAALVWMACGGQPPEAGPTASA